MISWAYFQNYGRFMK